MFDVPSLAKIFAVHTRTHTHVYTNFLDKSNGEKNQVSTGQVSLV